MNLMPRSAALLLLLASAALTAQQPGGWPRCQAKRAQPLKMGAPGASLLGTWENTNPSPLCRRKLAPPQVVADNFPTLTHNHSKGFSPIAPAQPVSRVPHP
jgi:hypothetical protein